jgi:hypothetical protein
MAEEEMKDSQFGWVLLLTIGTAFFTYFAASRGWGVAPLKDPKVVHSYRNKEPLKGQDYEAYARAADTLAKKYNDSLLLVQKRFNHTRDSLKAKGYNLASYESGKYNEPYNYEEYSDLNPYYVYLAESSPYRRRRTRTRSTRSRRDYSSSSRGTRSRNKYSSSSYPSSRRGTYGSNSSRSRSRRSSSGSYTSRNTYTSSARSRTRSRSSGSFRNTSRSFRGGSRRGGK